MKLTEQVKAELKQKGHTDKEIKAIMSKPLTQSKDMRIENRHGEFIGICNESDAIKYALKGYNVY